jgi:hypothetical protein
MTTPGFSVGFGSADITPAKGIQLAGDIGRYRPVEEVRMPLSARALAMRVQERRSAAERGEPC